VIQTVFDEGTGLLVQRVDIEARASRFAQQESMQKRNGHVAVVAVLTHYVFAGVLISGAGICALRRSQVYAEQGQNESTQSDAAVSLHY
jgi:hypothetical protein